MSRTVLLLWFLVAAAIPVVFIYEGGGWDSAIYLKSMRVAQTEPDVYRVATDIQKRVHAEMLAAGKTKLDGDPPYSYVYSPATLPILRMLGHLPLPLLYGIYWTLYGIGTLTVMCICMSFSEEREFGWTLYAAPILLFFPGLLANDTLISGNIAYIIYGAVFAAAFLGWKRGVWLPFYLCVICASVVKAPLLCLTLIAPLSAPRQWLRCGVTLAVGAGLFAVQPVLWPTLFRHYLEAVELQFSFNRDFGSNLVGLFSEVISRMGIPYSRWSAAFYLPYTATLLTALYRVSRRYFSGQISLREWGPIVLLGVILLNPRIQEYDIEPVTICLALILWRFLRSVRVGNLTWFALAVCGVAMEAASLWSWLARKALDGPLVTLIFAAGCWRLLRLSHDGERSVPAATRSAELVHTS